MHGRLVSIGEGTFTMGQRLELNALKKSVGDEIGERSLAQRCSSQDSPAELKVSENAALIVETFWPLVKDTTLVIPRGGYVLRQGLRTHYCRENTVLTILRLPMLCFGD